MMRNRAVWVAISFLMLAIFGTLLSCRGRNYYITKSGMIWNTTYKITYQGPEELSDSILVALEKVGSIVNVFDSTSNLSRINNGTTDVADSMLLTVVQCAKKVHVTTFGAFDPTLGPAIRAWGFGKGHNATEDTSRLDEMRGYIGFEKWNIENGKVKRADSRVELNLSGIAKGFGCDVVAEMFLRNGVENFMIEIGGELRLGGKSSTGAKWRIAIDKPVFSDSIIHDFLTTVSLTDCGMATSGNYRNFHTDSLGNRFGHTLNPETLRPASTDVLSATVIAPTAMEADAYATAFMVMGFDKASVLAEKINLAVLLVTNRNVWTSTAMKPFFTRTTE